MPNKKFIWLFAFYFLIIIFILLFQPFFHLISQSLLHSLQLKFYFSSNFQIIMSYFLNFEIFYILNIAMTKMFKVIFSFLIIVLLLLTIKCIAKILFIFAVFFLYRTSSSLTPLNIHCTAPPMLLVTYTIFSTSHFLNTITSIWLLFDFCTYKLSFHCNLFQCLKSILAKRNQLLF